MPLKHDLLVYWPEWSHYSCKRWSSGKRGWLLLAQPVEFSKMADDNGLVSVKVRTSLLDHRAKIKRICFYFFYHMVTRKELWYFLIVERLWLNQFYYVVHLLITYIFILTCPQYKLMYSLFLFKLIEFPIYTHAWNMCIFLIFEIL